MSEPPGIDAPAGAMGAAIHGIAAPAVERPADPTRLAEVLARADAKGLGVCVTGGATKLGWGGRPERFDLLVDTRDLSSPCEVDADDLTVTLGAGVTVAEARARAQAEGRILPLDAGCPGRATVGGVAATGDQGVRGTRYGRTRDLVLGLRAVLADGTAVKFGGRTMKNVAGYDMSKLFVGSFGVLGVLTEVTFRLLPRPETQGLMVIPIGSLAEAQALAAKVLDSNLEPLALEVVSPGLAGALPASPGVTPLVSAAKIGGRPLLLAGSAGHPAALDRFVAEVSTWADGAYTTVLRDDDAEAIYEALAERSVVADDGGADLRGAEGGAGGPSRHSGARLKARAVMPPAEVWNLAGRASSLAAGSDMPVDFHIGAARGVVDLWLGPGSGPTSSGESPGDDDRAAIIWVEAVRAAAVAAGGHLMVTGGWMRPPDDLDVWGDAGPSLRLMRAVKKQFDPRRTLNPGRFVGGI